MLDQSRVSQHHRVCSGFETTASCCLLKVSVFRHTMDILHIINNRTSVTRRNILWDMEMGEQPRRKRLFLVFHSFCESTSESTEAT